MSASFGVAIAADSFESYLNTLDNWEFRPFFNFPLGPNQGLSFSSFHAPLRDSILKKVDEDNVFQDI